MADGSSIEWTDATWNPVVGCSVVSPGCINCYAMKLAGGRLRNHPSRAGLTQPSKAGPVWIGKVRLWEPWLTQPFEWKTSRRIFVCAHGDLFHEDVPDEWIDKVFAVMALTPQHTYQVLTKRAQRMRAYFAERWQGTPAQDIRMPDGDIIHCPRGAETGRRHQVEQALRDIADQRQMIDPDIDEQWDDKGRLKIARFDRPLPNVWLGVSAEDQARADERIPHLLATPAAVRFISAEPLLGAIDLLKWFDPTGACCGGEPEFRCDNCPADADWRYSGECTAESLNEPRLDWVIAGGESGKGARPMHPDWVRSLRDQCAAAQVPFFFKQWGSWHPEIDRDRDDPDWRRDYGIINRQPDRFAILNLAGGCGFHGERVHLMASRSKASNGAAIDGKKHREFPT